MDNHTLRTLMGPIMGYDYINGGFGDDADLLARHQTELLLVGGNTRRFHTMRTITENTVAEHSWGVAALMWVMSGGKCSAVAMMAALTHDVAERYVGDVPSPTKRALGISDQLSAYEDTILATAQFDYALTEEEARWLKLADCYDGMMFCVRERSLGNLGIRIVYERFRSYVLAMNPTGLESSVLDAITHAWLKVNQ